MDRGGGGGGGGGGGSDVFRKNKNIAVLENIICLWPVSGAGLNEKTFPAYAHYVSCPFLQGSDNAVILNSGLVEHHGFGHNKVPIRQQCVLRFLYRIRVFMERQKYA